MKNKKLIFLFLTCTFTFLLFTFTFYSFAQDNSKLVALSKQIIEAKTDTELYAFFVELKDLYFKDNRYTDFVEFLKSLVNKKKSLEPFANYYIALSRYYQLKYLEETQNWDEYFSQGNSYRDEIVSAAQKAVGSAAAKDALNIYARLILWKFHKDQQDAFYETALSDLMNSVSEYRKEAKDLAPIKDVAHELLVYGEKGKSKELYRIYVDRLIASEKIKDEDLSNLALGFYKENNLELSQLVYDVYIERIEKAYAKDKLLPLLINIAKAFAYKDDGPKDAFYAEKVFQKIEEIGAKDAFDESLIYLRAFNLEKAKEYNRAKNIYQDLLKRYSLTAHADEANFKCGIIYTYILRDIVTGSNYFEKLGHSTSLSVNPKLVEGLAQKDKLSPQAISSLYQLGLLSQWKEDFVKAKEYYNILIGKAGNGFADTVTLAKERLKEIEEAKPIEYNLKTFLDVSLKEENIIFDTTKVELSVSSYKLKKERSANISSLSHAAESGCMPVEIEYLWSGHLGTVKPSLKEATFATTYTQPGTKEINLVVVSPSGVIDRNIDMVDVY